MVGTGSNGNLVAFAKLSYPAANETQRKESEIRPCASESIFLGFFVRW